MQRINDKIQKWFGEGIQYKGKTYIKFALLEGGDIIRMFTDDLDMADLSINDLLSIDCSFIRSLQFNSNVDNSLYLNAKRDEYMGFTFDKDYIGYAYQRMYISTLNDDQKILYILENTK